MRGVAALVVCRVSPCGDVKVEPKGMHRQSGHVPLDRALSCYDMLNHGLLCHAVLCYVMLNHAFVRLYHVVSRYVK